MKQDSEPQDPDQPVAYDAEGRPLYAAPQASVAVVPTQVVHFTRAVNPEKPEISEDVKRRHDESSRRYPQLNLSDGEYVISAVRRHPIGLVGPILITTLLVVIMTLGITEYPSIIETLSLANAPSFEIVILLGILAIIGVLIGGYIAIWVYLSNQFFLTNESVIQEIQLSLLSRNEQTVSLENIEDASYHKGGLLQTILDYGSIRLSTEGDETTYKFSYVANPKQQIAILNNAIEAFKNGRPIEG